MKIGCLERVQQRETTSETLIEPFYLGCARAGIDRDKLAPAVSLAVNRSQDSKRGMIALFIKPREQFRVMDVHAQRTRLVDNAEDAAETRDGYRPPAPVSLTRSDRYRRTIGRLGIIPKRMLDLTPA